VIDSGFNRYKGVGPGSWVSYVFDSRLGKGVNPGCHVSCAFDSGRKWGLVLYYRLVND